MQFEFPLSTGIYPEIKPKSFYPLPDEWHKCGAQKVKSTNPAYPDESIDITVPCPPVPSRYLKAQTPRKVSPLFNVFTCSTINETIYYENDTICNDNQGFEITTEDLNGTFIFFNEPVNFKMLDDDEYIIRYPMENGLLRIPQLNSGRVVRPKRDSLSFNWHVFDNQINFNRKITMTECGSTCDSGQIFKFVMNDGPYAIHFYMNPKVFTYITICFSPENFDNPELLPTCDLYNAVTIVPRSNLIIWPYRVRPATLRFGMRPEDYEMESYDDMAHAVPFTFALIDTDPSNPGTKYRFVIENAFYEYTESETGEFNFTLAHKLLVKFSADDALASKFGIVSKDIKSGYLVQTKIYDENLSSTEGPTTTESTTIETTTTDMTTETTTTTMAPVVAAIVSDHVADFAGSPDGLKKIEEAALEAEETTTDWLLVAIPLGFVIGTLLVVVFGGLILFVMRRTFYSVWYDALSEIEMILEEGGVPPGTGSGTPGSGSGTPGSGSGTPVKGSGTPLKGSGTPVKGSGTPVKRSGTAVKGSGTRVALSKESKASISQENESKDNVSKENGAKDNVSKENGANENVSKENGAKEPPSKEMVSNEMAPKENGSKEMVAQDLNQKSQYAV
ncbi:unnamed protein product [Caenorhabditis bovis]|uniref:Uncharacterized protein n=1 Tax=Caenorhabditis bovis TaxID=2654633 RepID=A0A8S1EST6_9PELO|nr:unnamed protein product [Caenorhabditis bovis]